MGGHEVRFAVLKPLLGNLFSRHLLPNRLDYSCVANALISSDQRDTVNYGS